MPSSIPGFEYDIFISYRQKDNKYDGWVTVFVDNLKRELEATFKEEISVYFDINPHNGLLATHDVDASLKEKLKCLIFIPIISRTYCDPKSFAWEHEFISFIKKASDDQFGLKIRLPGGNVASRVLPIQIHELDFDDKKLIESELGAFMRGVEFIYKEPGVNRPLTPNDDEKKNLNGTMYRNQINRVANALKEIISGLESFNPDLPKPEQTDDPDSSQEKKPVRFRIPARSIIYSKRGRIISALAVIVIAAILIFYPRVQKRDFLEELRSPDGTISVAVMPFTDYTADPELNYWSEGIQSKITYSLSDYPEELRVRLAESVNGVLISSGISNYTSLTDILRQKTSKKLEASIFIHGMINKSGKDLTVTANLYDAVKGLVLKSLLVKGPIQNADHLIDSLALTISNFMIVSKLKTKLTPDIRSYSYTEYPDAFRNFIAGKNSFLRGDYGAAVNFFTQAVDIDSNYTLASQMLALAYGDQGMYTEAKKWSLKVYSRRDKMPFHERIFANWMHALYFGTPEEEIDCLLQLREADDQLPFAYFELGSNYYVLEQYEKAASELRNALDIYERWNSKPMWVYNYTYLGQAYHKTGRYEDEKRLYRQAEKDFPDDPELIARQAILSLTERDTASAGRFLREYTSLQRKNSITQSVILEGIGDIYSEADVNDKADEAYRKAVRIESGNAQLLNKLAYFLIDKERDIAEGLRYADKALNTSPENYEYLETKGWGLFKLGKYKESVEILEKSWSLKPVYKQRLFLHLQEARKKI